MADLHWFPEEPAAWLLRTAALSPEAKGAYHDLRCYAWQAEKRGEPPCTIPDDDRQLARLTGLGSKWKRVAREVRPFFVSDGAGRLTEPELLHTWHEQTAKYERRATAGKKGGEAKAARKPSASNATGDASGIATSPASSNAEAERQPGRTEREGERERAEERGASPAGAPARDDLAIQRAAVALTRTANEAIAERWGEQPTVLHHASALELAESLTADGVSLEVARQSIVDQCARSKQPRPPRAMAYFGQGIRDAWAQEETRRVQEAASLDPIAASGRPDPGTGTAPRGARFDRDAETKRAVAETFATSMAVAGAMGLPSEKDLTPSPITVTP